MDALMVIAGIVLIVSIPLCGAIFLLSGVAEHYARKMEESLNMVSGNGPAITRPAPTLRSVAVVYCLMTGLGLWALLQPDRYLLILGVAVQTFALMIGFTTLMFTLKVVQIWKAKTAGMDMPSGLFQLPGPTR